VSLVVVTACLTVLFLSMRAVMSVGGYCASGTGVVWGWLSRRRRALAWPWSWSASPCCTSAGQLTDAEFAAAKQRQLEGE
jgi:hypothetical protein